MGITNSIHGLLENFPVPVCTSSGDLQDLTPEEKKNKMKVMLTSLTSGQILTFFCATSKL